MGYFCRQNKVHPSRLFQDTVIYEKIYFKHNPSFRNSFFITNNGMGTV